MDFKVLMENISPALKKIARKYLLTSFYDEDDLFQEMCLYIWQNYNQGLPVGINEGYVIKGCEFHILNYLRKGRVNFRMVSMDEPLGEEGLPLKEMIPDTSFNMLYDTDNRITIDDIKSKLFSEKEKQVLHLLTRGLTVREIGKEMGISHVMVIKHKKNIIKKAGVKGYQ